MLDERPIRTNRSPNRPVEIPRLDLSPKQRPSKSRSPLGGVQPSQPSLMAQTIADLQRKEAVKKSQSDLLLRSFEARSIRHSPSPPNRQAVSPPQRLLKGFSSCVHLQDPAKLRNRTEHPSLTYQQQLLALQEQTVPPPQPTLAEFKKVYGSNRVKLAGSNVSVRKHGQVKSYAERLKELKPAQLQARVVPRYIFLFLLIFAAKIIKKYLLKIAR